MSAVEWEPPQRAVNPHTFCPRDRYDMCDCGTATDPELVESGSWSYDVWPASTVTTSRCRRRVRSRRETPAETAGAQLPGRDGVGRTGRRLS